MFLGPSNFQTTCPPGKLTAPDGLPHVLVASLMRSGTHLAIDLILNNFRAYRKKPLYVDLDQYLHVEGSVDELLQAGGQVLKTHFPQAIESTDRGDAIRRIRSSSRTRVIILHRDIEDVRRSMGRFGEWGAAEVAKLDQQAKAFEAAWNSHRDAHRLSFPDLTHPEKGVATVERLARLLDQSPSADPPVLPRPRSHRNRVRLDKLMTRLVGKASPRINTTIGFAK